MTECITTTQRPDPMCLRLDSYPMVELRGSEGLVEIPADLRPALETARLRSDPPASAC